MGSTQPSHRLVQLSDFHFTEGNELLFDLVDTEQQLRRAFDRLADSGQRFDAVIISGDLADAGSAEAYQRLAGLVAEQGERLGAAILIGAGNHDLRGPLNAAFFDPDDAARPVDSVAVVRGLRIIHLDSSVPGAGHGHLDAAQLSWLAEVLADPAPHGSVLVVHHPPTPTSSELMGLVALRNPADLARALRGSDVRIILSGHMHASGTSMLAGIPVAICGALSHAADPLYDHLGHRGMTEGQSFTIVEFFADQVVTNVVPLTAHPTLRMVRPAEVAARLAR